MIAVYRKIWGIIDCTNFPDCFEAFIYVSIVLLVLIIITLILTIVTFLCVIRISNKKLASRVNNTESQSTELQSNSSFDSISHESFSVQHDKKNTNKAIKKWSRQKNLGKEFQKQEREQTIEKRSKEINSKFAYAHPDELIYEYKRRRQANKIPRPNVRLDEYNVNSNIRDWILSDKEDNFKKKPSRRANISSESESEEKYEVVKTKRNKKINKHKPPESIV
ncbi:hypothetical protein BpHYR1_008280 [Brachionus plicatilis]|uniref:Uncharacterized protein n=1 Tax=Brachionus plicatilis TaxID=10195 RepID=A0A3M7RZ82_BRAPC|nr:hypothetical protein BpHYR1_008280 [Brachionus plicatilis]